MGGGVAVVGGGAGAGVGIYYGTQKVTQNEEKLKSPSAKGREDRVVSGSDGKSSNTETQVGRGSSSGESAGELVSPTEVTGVK